MVVNLLDKITVLKSLFPFSMLDDEDLQRIAVYFEQVNFPAGTTVFSDGYPASDLYFILSGKVNITLHHAKKDQNLGIIGTGDHFGEEALSGKQAYQTRAVCLSPVTVLRIRADKARAIADAFPDINAAFTLFQKTCRLTCTESYLGALRTRGLNSSAAGIQSSCSYVYSLQAGLFWWAFLFCSFLLWLRKIFTFHC